MLGSKVFFLKTVQLANHILGKSNKKMAVGFGSALGDVHAHWENWWSELGLTFSNLTGPLAPHLFLCCTVWPSPL